MSKIKIRGQGDKGREVVVHREMVLPQVKGKSTWVWHEDFTREWEKNYSLSPAYRGGSRYRRERTG